MSYHAMSWDAMAQSALLPEPPTPVTLRASQYQLGIPKDERLGDSSF